MKKIIAYWNRIGIWVSGATMLAMMFLTALDVLGRYVFKHPISGTADLTEVMMVVIVFLALSDTASSGGHISVEVVTSHLSRRKQLLMKAVTLFFSSLISAVLAWRLGANALYTLNNPEFTDVLALPIAPFLCISALGCGMLAFAFLGVAGDSLWKFLGWQEVK